jgi:hypothetical protein
MRALLPKLEARYVELLGLRGVGEAELGVPGWYFGFDCFDEGAEDGVAEARACVLRWVSGEHFACFL